MKPNRTMDWLLVIVPGFLAVKLFLEKDIISGVIWLTVSILYLIYALTLLKKDRAAAKNAENNKTGADDSESGQSDESIPERTGCDASAEHPEEASVKYSSENDNFHEEEKN